MSLQKDILPFVAIAAIALVAFTAAALVAFSPAILLH
jgi:hypothetical protein